MLEYHYRQFKILGALDIQLKFCYIYLIYIKLLKTMYITIPCILGVISFNIYTKRMGSTSSAL